MHITRITRRFYLVCFGLYLFLILWICFRPSFELTDQQRTFHGWMSLWRLFSLHHALESHSLRDIITNFILYVPLGGIAASYALTGINDPERLKRRPGPWISAVFWLISGILLTFLIETFQYFTGRFSDAVDVLSNGFGYMTGFFVVACWCLIFNYQPSKLLGFRDDFELFDFRTASLVILHRGLIVFYLMAGLYPFDITVGVYQIYRQLLTKPPGIVFDWMLFSRDYQSLWIELLIENFLLIVLAVITGRLALMRLKHASLSPVVQCLTLYLIVELMQLCVLSRSSVFSGVFPVSIFSVLFGFCLFIPFSRRDLFKMELIHSRSIWLAVSVLAAMVLMMVSLHPYHFYGDMEHAARLIADILLVQADRWDWRLWSCVMDFRVRTGGILFIFFFFSISMMRGARTWVSAFFRVFMIWLLGSGLSVFVELSQAFVVGNKVELKRLAAGVIGALSAPVLYGIIRLILGSSFSSQTDDKRCRSDKSPGRLKSEKEPPESSKPTGPTEKRKLQSE